MPLAEGSKIDRKARRRSVCCLRMRFNYLVAHLQHEGIVNGKSCFQFRARTVRVGKNGTSVCVHLGSTTDGERGSSSKSKG